MELTILLGMGAIAGMLAGLLGIGGGIIIVPVLALVFAAQGVSDSVIMHVAIGTSLATIVTTSLSSIRAHQKHRAIDWAVFRRITPGILVGAAAGTMIAKLIPGSELRIIFGLFMLFVATQMIIGASPKAHRQLPKSLGLNFAGTIIGAISSLMGVGGGSMSVPFLSFCNMPVRRAIATSAAIGLPIAIAGTSGFIITGLDVGNRPPWSIGYINLPAYTGIVLASTIFAPLGAALAHRIPPLALKRFFGIFLLILGARILLF